MQVRQTPVSVYLSIEIEIVHWLDEDLSRRALVLKFRLFFLPRRCLLRYLEKHDGNLSPGAFLY